MIVKEDNIRDLELLIKQMERDGDIFGLVREDRDKILKWKLKIRELKKKEDLT